jgi:DNA-directed RNA polymerase specialized sigma24 family protein
VNRRFRGARPRLESLDACGAPELPAAAASPDRAVDARRVLKRCEAVIERDFTPLQRRIFHLKHLRRQSIRTIARALGKSEDAIKANLYRMRRSIAEEAPGLETLLGL